MFEVLDFILKEVAQRDSFEIVASSEDLDSWEAGQMLFFSLNSQNKKATLTEYKEFCDRLKLKNHFRPPKADFLISIKEGGKKISRLFYEKNGDGLNLFLETKDNNKLNPADIFVQSLFNHSLCFFIGLSKNNFTLPENFSGFVINIDNYSDGEHFGNLNYLQTGFAKKELVFLLIKKLGQAFLEKQILALGEKISFSQKHLLERALCNLNFFSSKNLLFTFLDRNDFFFSHAVEKDLKFSLEHLTKGLFPFQDFLLLWEQNQSVPHISGVFFSLENHTAFQKLTSAFFSQRKQNSLLFYTNFSDMVEAKEAVLKFI